MQFLRGVLIVMILVIYGYTAVVMGRDGFDFISPFLSNIRAVNWSGQFNLDFMCYLGMSAAWVAWRHRFSSAGLGMAALAAVFGFMFLAPYVVVAMTRAKGNVTMLVLGEQARV